MAALEGTIRVESVYEGGVKDFLLEQGSHYVILFSIFSEVAAEEVVEEASAAVAVVKVEEASAAVKVEEVAADEVAVMPEEVVVGEVEEVE